MQPQAPQTNAAQHSSANQSVEQLASREFQQQAIGLDLANLVSEYSSDELLTVAKLDSKEVVVSVDQSEYDATVWSAGSSCG